jgi:ABC-type uncharacterized transport system YnjBCD substrate-binding protein
MFKMDLLGKASRTGKGHATRYTRIHVQKVVLAIELSEAGMPPSLVVQLVRQFWRTQFSPVFAQAEGRALMTFNASEEDIALVFTDMAFRSDRLRGTLSPQIGSAPIRLLPTTMMAASSRAMAFNITDRLRRFYSEE